MIYDFSPGDSQSPIDRAVDFRSDEEQDNAAISIHNPDSQDLVTALRMATEQLRIIGALVNVYIRTDNADFDGVWDEDPDPTYHPAEQLRGFFKPQPLEFELKRWGVDAINKTEVVFAASDLGRIWGERMLRPGDVLELPYNNPAGNPGNGGSLNPGFYRIVNTSPSGNFRYNWLYYTATCETLTADVTVRVADDMPHELPSGFNGRPDDGSASGY